MTQRPNDTRLSVPRDRDNDYTQEAANGLKFAANFEAYPWVKVCAAGTRTLVFATAALL